MSRLRRPSGGLIVACVALFVALSGGAYAAVTQLAPGSVTHADLAKNAVWHANIGKGSVQMGNLSKDLQTALDKAGGVGVQGAGTTVIGPQGPQGTTGPQGPAGPSGVNSPLVYTFSGTTGPDTGTCGPGPTGNGDIWAIDTDDATFQVEPNVDGSYTVVKIVKGTFTTQAGPSPAACASGTNNGSTVSAGKTGTFYGSETWTVPAPGSGQSADFDPVAACSDCSPNTVSSNDSSDHAQNVAFVTAFFPGAMSGTTPPQFDTNYDFVYTSGNQTWTDSNTPRNGQGDITG